MAQEKYGFFDSSGEDIRSYSAADMANAFHALASNGVTDADSCLQVTAEGSTMRVLVGYGTALIQGYYYQLRDDGGGVQAVEHTTEAALSRIDRIVLRLDLMARTIALGKLIGTAASTPSAPELTRTDEIYELSLATVYIVAGASEILAENITDDRETDALCGLIAPESLRRGDIQTMIADAVDAAIAESEAGFADVLRFGAQTLTAGEQTQVRANVGAQAGITAAGVLKGDGSGGVSAAAAGTDYGIPAVEVSATLSTAWTGSAAPFTQDVTVAGMTAAKKAIVGLPATVTQAEYLAAAAAMLRVSAQGTDTITVTAEGTVPTISIPILIEILG